MAKDNLRLDEVRRRLDASSFTVGSFSEERARVAARDGQVYLLHFLGWYRLVRPGWVNKRLQAWREHGGRRVSGHIVLASGEASPTLESEIELDRRALAVVTQFRTDKHLALSPRADENMREILRVLGVPVTTYPEVRPRPQVAATDGQSPEAEGPIGHFLIPPGSGAQIDEYRLSERLGAGRTSTVMAAKVTSPVRELGLTAGQDVALKFYDLWVLQQTFQFERIGRELFTVSRISNPSVVRIFDLRISPLRPHRTYLVMELVRGQDFFSVLSPGPELLDFDAVLYYSHQIFNGLAALHRAGVLHRDIKPENVMLSEDGIVKIMDFGVVKPIEASQQMTGQMEFLGTIRYAAPEYLSTRACDERSDIYSAAAVCYFMLAGRELVPKELYFVDQIMAVLGDQQNLRDVARSRERGLAELLDVLASCLSRSPEGRPKTAAEVAGVIRNIRRSRGASQQDLDLLRPGQEGAPRR